MNRVADQNQTNINASVGGNREMIGAAHPGRTILTLVALAIAVLVAIRCAEVVYRNNVDQSAVFPNMVPLEALATLVVVGLAVLILRANRRLQ